MKHELRRSVGLSLLSQTWVFAKTMPTNPHWYTVRKSWADDGAFVRAVEAIREHGYRVKYGRSYYTVFDLNGMMYWTMGAPLPSTRLINRKQLRPASPYDAIAPLYDEAFSDQESRADTETVMALLGDVSNQRVLDIGCGTGVFLDHHRPGGYVGIDPSAGMLQRLTEKHPSRLHDVIQCPLESYVGAEFDLVVSLFGPASYADARAVASIPTFLKPGGRYLAMFYRPGYVPVTYERTHVQPLSHDTGNECLAGDRHEFGNFVVVTGVAA